MTVAGSFSHFGPFENYVQIALDEIVRKELESCLLHLLKDENPFVFHGT